MRWTEWLRPAAGALLLLAAMLAFIAGVGARYRPVPAEALPLPAPVLRAQHVSNATDAATPGWRASSAAPSNLSPAPLRIYRCLKDGVPAFAAMPCGPRAQVTVLDPAELNTYHAPPVRARTPLSQPSEPDQPGAAAGDARRDYDCAAVEAAIRSVEDALRHPYVEPRGNHLRAQLHELLGQRFELHCGR